MVMLGIFRIFMGFISFFVAPLGGLILIIFGVIITLAGIGLFKTELWAWYFALLSVGLSAILYSFDAIDGDLISIIGLIISLLIILYLFIVSSQFDEQQQIPTTTSETKDDAFYALFGKEKINSEYFNEKAKFKCPKCGSNNIELMHDGSGICNDCKLTFQEAIKVEN